jgi:prepilin-type processing-associated H-X9-DG protein
MNARRAFTLVELLVVAGVLVVLVALVLSALSRAKGLAHSAVCKNNLSQVGRAMQMYVSDFDVYPSAMGGGGPPFRIWADQLAPYNPINWTNVTWHCPTFIAEGGKVIWQPPPPEGGHFKVSGSYAYNGFGTRGYEISSSGEFGKWPWLGLGDLNLTVRDNRIVAPSEMYAVADARPIQYQNSGGFVGRVEMEPWQLLPSILNAQFTEANPPHAEGYNLLFADGHVNLAKRTDYLYPPRTARNWNRDNKAHLELWCPTSEWVITK